MSASLFCKLRYRLNPKGRLYKYWHTSTAHLCEMTKFGNLCKDILALEVKCVTVCEEIPSDEAAYNQLLAYYKSAMDMQDVLTPYIDKAALGVRDPDNRIYGEAMTAKIQKIASTMSGLCEILEGACDRAKQYWVPRLQELENIAAAEVQRKLEEQQQVQLEQERIKEQAAKERLRLEEERRNAEINAQLELERREKEQRLAERAVYEAELEVRKQQRIAEERQRKDEEARKARMEGISIEEALVLLENSNTGDVFSSVLSACEKLCRNVIDCPEDPKYRHLRVSNESLQSDITSHAGGEAMLYGIGFKQKSLTQPTKELYYVLEEPDASQDMGQWVNWFDNLQCILDKIEETMAML